MHVHTFEQGRASVRTSRADEANEDCAGKDNWHGIKLRCQYLVS